MTYEAEASPPLTDSQRAMYAARMVIRGDCKQLGDAAAAMSVAQPYVSHAKTVLNEGSAEEIAAVERDECNVVTTALRIRARRDGNVVRLPVIARRKATKGHGPSVRPLPNGVVPEDLGRQAIELRKSLRSVGDVASQLGVKGTYCRYIIDIVLVADRTDLSPEHTALAQAALKAVNAQKISIAQIHDAIKPIVYRLWGKARRGSSRDTREHARSERFEHGLGVLVQACKNGSRIEVPHLSPKRAKQVVGELQQSIHDIKVLASRLKGGGE